MEFFLSLYFFCSMFFSIPVFLFYVGGALDEYLQDLTKAQIIFWVFVSGPFIWVLGIGILIDRALSKVGRKQKKH